MLTLHAASHMSADNCGDVRAAKSCVAGSSAATPAAAAMGEAPFLAASGVLEASFVRCGPSSALMSQPEIRVGSGCFVKPRSTTLTFAQEQPSLEPYSSPTLILLYSFCSMEAKQRSLDHVEHVRGPAAGASSGFDAHLFTYCSASVTSLVEPGIVHLCSHSVVQGLGPGHDLRRQRPAAAAGGAAAGRRSAASRRRQCSRPIGRSAVCCGCSARGHCLHRCWCARQADDQLVNWQLADLSRRKEQLLIWFSSPVCTERDSPAMEPWWPKSSHHGPFTGY